PPKVGGIQSYVWELVRRLPPHETVVLTTPHPAAAAFDGEQPFRVVRARTGVLWPTGRQAQQINELAASIDAGVIVIDPPMPVGLLHRRLARPYAVVLHGGVVSQARLPGVRALLRRVLTGAVRIVTAGQFAADEAARAAG